MPPFIDTIRQQLLALWNPLSRVQKISLGAITIAAVAAIGYFAFSASQPNYVTVFSKLGEAEAGAIADKLKEMKVPYELADGGATIKVPAAQANAARIELAKAGLPQQGGVGYEIFDKNTFGLTEFNQKLNYQRALEGELGRTISQMAGIESARVHIVVPTKELFSKNEEKPTASVQLKLKAGARLDTGNTRAIANLITGAVEGLKAEGVTIMDSQGNVLWDEKTTGTGSNVKVAQDFLDARTRLEHETEQKILQMLEKVLGPGRATAKVSADLDWDQVQVNKETLGQSTAVSSKEITERYTGTGGAGAVPGVSPNIPGGNAGGTGTGAGQPNNYEKREVTTNFQTPKTVEQVIKAPGSIKKLSIAVFIDNLPDPNGLPAISQAVSSAAGIDQARGDTVTVSNITFDRTTQEADQRAVEAAAQQDLYLTGARAAGIALALLVAAMFLRSMFAPKKVERVSKPTIVVEDPEDGFPQLEGEQPLSIGQLITSSGHSVEDAFNQARLKVAKDLTKPMDPELQALQEAIEHLAEHKPQRVAAILQAWLEEVEQDG